MWSSYDCKKLFSALCICKKSFLNKLGLQIQQFAGKKKLPQIQLIVKSVADLTSTTVACPTSKNSGKITIIMLGKGT